MYSKNNFKWLSFDDVLLAPQFSDIDSRSQVDTSEWFCGINLLTPIISSNMDTVTGPRMAHAMSSNGGLSALHRFQTVEDNVKQFQESPKETIGSFGLGANELERAVALYEAGCRTLLLDVAHGACMAAVKQIQQLNDIVSPDTNIIVGNFANLQSIESFCYHLGNKNLISAVKVGIGSGAACTTRVVTGSGAPLLSSIKDCSLYGLPVIADGGIRGSGDYAKALAAGASVVMCGRLFAGTEESPGQIYAKWGNEFIDLKDCGAHMIHEVKRYKKYRGSASQESYQVQGKVSSHRTPEGEAYLIPYVGNVKEVIEQMNAGLRSAMTYSGARALYEFREKAEFIEITQAGNIESGPHGKNT